MGDGAGWAVLLQGFSEMAILDREWEKVIFAVRIFAFCVRDDTKVGQRSCGDDIVGNRKCIIPVLLDSRMTNWADRIADQPPLFRANAMMETF